MGIKTNFSILPVANVTRTRFIEKAVNGREWVSYGDRNTYPEYLWKLYTQSPTQQAIIDAKTAFTIGGGLENDKVINHNGETLTEVLKKAVFDLHLFGGFALQVIYNEMGDILEIYWADFSKLRINKHGNKVYWCDNWHGSPNGAIIEYDTFNPRMSNKTTQIFYYRGASCRSVYPIPSYVSAVDALETEIAIQDYHLNAIHNGFAVSAIINMNGGVPEDEERETMERKINAKFSGNENAGRTLICWNSDKDAATTVERLETDNFDKKFEQLRRDTREAIFIAHRITSGTLLGVQPTNTGFTRNEYLESFDILQATVISPYQKEIETCMKKILPDGNIRILPFVIAKNN